MQAGGPHEPRHPMTSASLAVLSQRAMHEGTSVSLATFQMRLCNERQQSSIGLRPNPWFPDRPRMIAAA
jgi:hypothetical protein